MRTWISISLVLFVLLTIALTILLSDFNISNDPVRGMNVEVTEGNVRVINGPHSDTVHAGEKATVSENGQISKSKTEHNVERSIADAEVNTATIFQSDTVKSPTVTQATDSTIEYATKEFFYIAGYVQNEEGEFLRNSDITCRRIEENRIVPIRNTESNSDGYYIIQIEKPGEFEIKSSPVEDEYLEETKTARLNETQKNTSVFFVHQRGALAFKGRVIAKKDNKPIVNAEIRINNFHDAKHHRATSDENGRFFIKKIAEGEYNVFATAEGYIDFDAHERRMQRIAEPLANIHISLDTQSNEYTIKMEEAGAVTVFVVDGEKSPVPFVRVTAHPYGNSQQSESHTDSNGTAKFTNIPPGKVLFRTQKEGYGETSSDIVETGAFDAPTEVTIVLSAPASISGQITYQDGSPAEGWDIFVHNLSTAHRVELLSIISTRVKTDSNGNYAISDLGKGEYTFFIFKYVDSGRKRVATDRVVTLKDGENKQGVDFVLDEGDGTVTGIVISEEGKSVPGARVTIIPQGVSGTNIIRAEEVSVTDQNGEFISGKLHLKEGGTIKVEVTAEGYKPFEDGIFPVGEYVTVSLGPAEIISGIVVEQTSRQPIPGANVIMRGSSQSDRVALTDGNGSFKFFDFPDRQYSLFAFADGYAYSKVQTVDTESGQPFNEIVLELEKATEFRGIVADPSGQPVMGAIVGLESRMKNRNSQEEYRGLLFSETFLSNENGEFIISNRSHQADMLIIQHPHFATNVYPLSAEWDKDRPPVIYLNLGGTIEGIVLNEEQNPITKGEVHCIGDPNLLFGAKVKIDPNGRYRIEHLPASNYRLFVRTEGVMMEPAQVTEGQTTQVDFAAEEQKN